MCAFTDPNQHLRLAKNSLTKEKTGALHFINAPYKICDRCVIPKYDWIAETQWNESFSAPETKNLKQA